MNRLEKLTLEQEKLMQAVKDEWIHFALYGGDELDTTEATKGIEWLYQKASLKQPLIIFLDSPLAVQYGVTLATKLLEAEGSAVHAQAAAFGVPDEDYLLIKDRG